MFAKLVERVPAILDSNNNRIGKLEAVCKLLKDSVEHYDWVGFYVASKEKPNELILIAYVGEPSEHTRISFGEGICGQAAELKKTIVAQDVSKETNYLSCSTKVKSEIVVPIFRNNEVVGELDIDSHSTCPFTNDDEILLKKIAEMTEKLL